MEVVANKFIDFDFDFPELYKLKAQSIIDQNNLKQSLRLLNKHKANVENDPKEGPEIRGLLGRTYKQRYINEGNPDDLIQAISAYSEDWKNKKSIWHGINYTALLARAKKDGIKPEVAEDYKKVATSILNAIEDLDHKYVWDFATAMEAAIALEDDKEALKWAKKYVRHPEADAFELSSTLRQNERSLATRRYRAW